MTSLSRCIEEGCQDSVFARGKCFKHSSEPEHHRKYRVAWMAYRDPDTPKDCLEDLQKEMDSAQDHFGWDEFQEFKVTLEGFEEFWKSWSLEAMRAVEKLKKMDD